MKLISHPIFLEHKTHEDHIENPDRIGYFLDGYKYIMAPRAGKKLLKKFHSENYITFVEESCPDKPEEINYLNNNPDNYMNHKTFEAACYAVGASVKAAELATQGENAFALVRPPGHHAHRAYGHGFCFFNNIAVASQHILTTNPKHRLLLIDIDIHRGEGTEEYIRRYAHYKNLRLISFYQSNIFPGPRTNPIIPEILDAPQEPGVLEQQSWSALERKIKRVFTTFRPTIIGISAGFDSFHKDSLMFGNTLGFDLHLTQQTIKKLKQLIDPLPYFCVLEGGYNPESIKEGVEAFLEE